MMVQAMNNVKGRVDLDGPKCENKLCRITDAIYISGI